MVLLHFRPLKRNKTKLELDIYDKRSKEKATGQERNRILPRDLIMDNQLHESPFSQVQT